MPCVFPKSKRPLRTCRRRPAYLRFFPALALLGGCSATLPHAGAPSPATGFRTVGVYDPAGGPSRIDPARLRVDGPVRTPDPLAQNTTKRDAPELHYGSGQFAAPVARGAEKTSEGDIVLNFAEMDVRQVAQAVLGDMLAANFVVDADAQARITLRTNRPLAKEALVPTLETAFATAGLALVMDGGLYRILPMAKAKGNGSAMRFAKNGEALPPGYGVTAVPLSHVAPSEMARVLEPLAPERSILRIDDARNLLVLAAIGPEMNTLLETIEMFDIDAMKGMSFGYFKIGSARVSEVAAELASVMKAQAEQAGTRAAKLVPIERLNALLVISAQPETLKIAETWIARLDKAESGIERRLFVYHVKNRKAKEIAAILSDVFANEDAKTAAAAEPPPGGGAPDTATIELASADPAADLPRRVSPGESPKPAQSLELANGVKIGVDEDNNALLIRASAGDYQSISAAIERLDLVPPLVLVEVTIAEVKLKDGLKLGIEWFFKKKQSEYTFSAVPSGQILSKFPGFSYFFSAADVAGVLNAMSEITDVRIVSSPRVMVRDNKTATLQIGDQVPVITSTSQSVSAPNAPVVQTVQYFDTGVILKVTPQVNARGLVTMDVNQEVSNVARQKEGGVDSPTIQQRKLSSSVAIQSGEAIVLGGLMREGRSETGTGVPLIGDVPLIGELFRTHDNETERTELLVIISPKVVWGRADARAVTDELRQQMESLVTQ